jgi:cytochrome c peroxidase
VLNRGHLLVGFALIFCGGCVGLQPQPLAPSTLVELQRVCTSGSDTPTTNGETMALCKSGATLFLDRRLSFDGLASCGDCHLRPTQDLGTDRTASSLSKASEPRAPESLQAVGQLLGPLPLARPHLRRPPGVGPRAPSLADIGRRPEHGLYFWNGRAPSRTAAVYWPLFDRRELGATADTLAPFGGADAVAERISVFLSHLTLGASRSEGAFDHEPSHAGSKTVQRGLRVYRNGGCAQASCHALPEARSDSLVPVRYTNLNPRLFTTSEASYSGDQELHAGVKPVVTLRTVPPTLRNLQLRGPPWGRFGQETSLEAFLKKHCASLSVATYPCRVPDHEADFESLLSFLTVGLASP